LSDGARGNRALAAWTAADAFVVLVFGLSRVVYRTVFGMRFDASPPSYFIQYLDPWFVEHDFLRSVLHLHHQAPLQILLAQGTSKLFGPAQATVILDAAYLAMGLALGVVLLRILRRLGAPAGLAAAAVALYVAAPTTVLYEAWLFYPFPTAVLLALSLLAILRFYERATFRAALAFFSTLAVVALLRATFGTVFLLAAIALLLVVPPRAALRRTIAAAAAVPLLVVTLNAAKTSWLVGHSYGTALLWQNLCTKIYTRLALGEQSRLLQAGLVSAAADYRGVVGDPQGYGRFFVPHAPTGVPLLDMDHTPAGGLNAHAIEHVLVAERYYRPDALYLLRHFPGVYAASVWDGLSTEYVSSPAQVDCLDIEQNFTRLTRVRVLADRMFLGHGPGRFGVLVVGLPLAIVYALWRLFGPRAQAPSGRSCRVAVAYALLTIAYAAAATLLVSYGDFSRYRFEVDPLYLVLLVLCAADMGRAARRVAIPRLRWR
jgi:hypothetical protein